MSDKSRRVSTLGLHDVPRRDFLKTSAGAVAAFLSRGVPAASDAPASTSADQNASLAIAQSKRATSGMIAVPKSGGAVSGIGETFVPDPQTGTEGITIPLPLTKGRDGFGPQLHLEYSVAHGNGIFGIGWKLNLEDVSRKTQGALPRYDDTDSFLLAGAELRRDPGPAQNRGDYQVLKFRLRHEGSFSRIEQWVRHRGAAHPASAASSFWCVTSQDNITRIFGATEDAVVADPSDRAIPHPADRRRIFRWMLQLEYDGKGNVVQYLYKPEDEVSVPAEERGRPVSQSYLKQIRYGNLTPIAFADPSAALAFIRRGSLRDAFFFNAVFDYGEHGRVESRDSIVTDDIDQPVKPWDARADAFSSHRQGFEVRTRRTCKRVLMFHRVPESIRPALVGSLDFLQSPPDPRVFRTVTQLEEVVRRGYAPAADIGWNDSEDYDPVTHRGVRSRSHHIASVPPLTFRYTEVKPAPDFRNAMPVRAQGLPPDGLANPNVALVDLFHRGAPDLLLTSTGVYWYWKNAGDGSFKAGTTTSAAPQGGGGAPPVILNDPGVGFGEITSDEFPDLLVTPLSAGGEEAGYCIGEPGSQNRAPQWENYKPFNRKLPFRLTDPQIRFLDMTGDGRLDILRSERGAVHSFEARGAEGFVGPQHSTGLDRLPRVSFDDPQIQVADMNGDGLADIVQYDGDAIHYWPNLGLGKFGARVTMARSPQGLVNPGNVFFVDIDGTGPADLIYVEGDHVQCWLNLCGNAWTPRFLVTGTLGPAFGPPKLVDLLGRGIAGLLWATPDTQDLGRYLQLTEAKPYLLESVNNGMGRRTEYRYRSSTSFALDAAAEDSWRERLPFPVYVLSSIVRHDDIARSTLVSTFSYAHGSYDTAEKEFRGFGRVDQDDAEFEQTIIRRGDRAAVPRELRQPPVRTRRWYHTVGRADGAMPRRYQDEYYKRDLAAPRLESSLPDGVAGERALEAARALVGRPIRSEVWALGADRKGPHPQHPYAVTEHGYVVEQLIPGVDARTMSCYAREDQKVHLRYEQQAGDPQVTHEFVLRVDDYGHALESASIAYARRSGGLADQTRPLATYTVRRYASRASDAGFRHGAAIEEQTFELLNLPIGSTAPTRAQLLEWCRSAAALPFDTPPQPFVRQKRLVAHARHYFLCDDGRCVLPLGEVGLRALPHHTLRRALTPGRLNAVYGSRVRGELATEGGYVVDQGDWWVPDGHPELGAVTFDVDRFCLPVAWTDEHGHASRGVYDRYWLALVETTDALKNVTYAFIDYRTLLPHTVQDFNGNRTFYAFDALGRVTATAVAGKANQSLGDSLAGYRTHLSYQTIRSYMADPLRAGPSILGSATTRVVYDIWCHHRAASGQRVASPIVVSTLARETHVSDLPPGQTTAIQHTMVYSDGFGREVQTKSRTTAGPVPIRQPDGTFVLDERRPGRADPRWIGSGATLYDNKGSPIKKYEPFFSPTHRFDSDLALTCWGVTATFRYDPLGRLMRTDQPDGTFTLVTISPWQQNESDASDTVLTSRWYRERMTLTDPADPERRAAELSEAHAGTHTVVHFDPLQRPVLRVVDNGPLGKYSTHTALDIQGNALRVTDARRNPCLISDFDMLGRALRTRSIDSGTRVILPNASGNAIREWDGAGHVIRREYDALKRPSTVFAAPAGAAERLAERYIYGESVPDAAAANLLGELHVRQTDATTITNTYDFKRNVHRWTQKVASAAPAQDLELSRVTLYDALNRPHRVVQPDGSEVRTSYDEGGRVSAVLVRPNQRSLFRLHVPGIEYNARGQRTRMSYENGVSVAHVYHPQTFRLSRLTSTRRDRRLLQDLSYTYDAVGNVVEIVDRAQPTVFFKNTPVEPRSRFKYDAVHRLVSAEGREHFSVATAPSRDRGAVRIEVPYPPPPPHPNDGQALTTYYEAYIYDEVGNLQTRDHRSGAGGWTSHYEYAPGTNRLSACGSGTALEKYSHDENGNVRTMESTRLEWDHAGRLRGYHAGGTDAAYDYDGTGTRTRKAVQRGPDNDERVYAMDYERFTRRKKDVVELMRQTTHISVGAIRVSSIESAVTPAGGTGAPAARTRYRLHDHLESVHFEVDDAGNIVSYEEYHPFGTSAYRAGQNDTEVSEKRFRYLGKELDEETGLYYFGARYYAPWVGRWISCDPLGLKDGPNLYAYVGNNPVRFVDRVGLSRSDKEEGDVGAGMTGSDAPWSVVPQTDAASDSSSDVGSGAEETSGTPSISKADERPTAAAPEPPQEKPEPPQGKEDVAQTREEKELQMWKAERRHDMRRDLDSLEYREHRLTREYDKVNAKHEAAASKRDELLGALKNEAITSTVAPLRGIPVVGGFIAGGAGAVAKHFVGDGKQGTEQRDMHSSGRRLLQTGLSQYAKRYGTEAGKKVASGLPIAGAAVDTLAELSDFKSVRGALNHQLRDVARLSAQRVEVQAKLQETREEIRYLRAWLR